MAQSLFFFLVFSCLSFVLILLNGCTGVAIGAGASVGTAAMEERGIRGVVDDTAIRIRLNGLLSKSDERLWRKISFQVHGGRVLLTGIVETPEMRVMAVRLAWGAEGVTEVINEILIGESGGVLGLGRDLLISTKLKSRLLFDKEILSINYSIETVEGIIFLIGIAQNREELDRVLNHARSLDYVRKVKNYVIIKRTERHGSNTAN